MKRYTFAAVLTAVCVVFTSGLHAQADIGVKGAGGKLSFVSPNDIDATIGFGAFLDLGTITPELSLRAGVDYWSTSEDVLLAEWSWNDLILSAHAVYNFELENPRVKPYAGGGLAIHLSKVEVPKTTLLGVTVGGEDASTDIGLDLLGGVGFQAAEKVDIFGEAMYRIVSDIGQFVISGGFVVWFGE